MRREYLIENFSGTEKQVEPHLRSALTQDDDALRPESEITSYIGDILHIYIDALKHGHVTTAEKVLQFMQQHYPNVRLYVGLELQRDMRQISRILYEAINSTSNSQHVESVRLLISMLIVAPFLEANTKADGSLTNLLERLISLLLEHILSIKDDKQADLVRIFMFSFPRFDVQSKVSGVCQQRCRLNT